MEEQISIDAAVGCGHSDLVLSRSQVVIQGLCPSYGLEQCGFHNDSLRVAAVQRKGLLYIHSIVNVHIVSCAAYAVAVIKVQLIFAVCRHIDRIGHRRAGGHSYRTVAAAVIGHIIAGIRASAGSERSAGKAGVFRFIHIAAGASQGKAYDFIAARLGDGHIVRVSKQGIRDFHGNAAVVVYRISTL